MENITNTKPIIDVHAHLGYDYVFDHDFRKEKLIYNLEHNNVVKTIVQPALARPYMEEVKRYHDDIAALCREYQGSFYGMASISPHFRPDDLSFELSRCINDLGFIAIKLTPIGHACSPSCKDGMFLFSEAKRLKAPLMVHTGAGAPFANPTELIAPLEKYLDVTVIVAHAGSEQFADEARRLCVYPNVYYDASWLGDISTRQLIDAAGADRILFATDHADNFPIELAKYRSVCKNGELDRILSKNALDLFKFNL
ncbi:MAG: amidohydrolase family protein [Oscillospiraceae bacterium]|nr:amidohydrolase family protein [Oscillospiraceae bacterium]